MIALHGSTDIAAIDVLQECSLRPPDTELLPLLALSVLATRIPFSAGEVGSLAVQMSKRFEANDQADAARKLLAACGSSLERCGALEAAADLRESQAIRHWSARRGTSEIRTPASD